MAEQIISPGAYSREQDNSFLSPAPALVSTAIVGPTAKGPVDIPTVVTSYSEYVSVYGDRFKSGSNYYTHLTSITAEKFFEQGGDTLLVTRVASGSFTSAQATIVDSSTSSSLVIETLAEGVIMNNSGSIGTNDALTTGSSDNIRWEVSTSDVNSGTFTLLIRRGDDTQKEKIILETWSNLSLDPNSDNYVSKIIGDMSYSNNGSEIAESGSYENKSRYIRVSSVTQPTLDYFDNNGSPKSAYTASLPAVGSGSIAGAFSGATGDLFSTSRQARFFEQINGTDTQGLNVNAGAVSAYTNALGVLNNKDVYNYKVLVTPGLNQRLHGTTVGSFIDLVQERGDAIYVLDLGAYGDAISTVVTEAAELNSSYAAAYYPWLKVSSQQVNRQVWAPASTVIPGVFAFSDNVGEEWFAPAGFARGGVPGVLRPEKKLSQSNRNTLYQGKINPIATFPGAGVVVYGQKTLQTKASALDRVNVRRALLAFKRFVENEAKNITFEQNTGATRARFLAAVNPYLDGVVQRQGLYAYRVVMDDTNNTADVIDRNQIVGQLYLQPTRTGEIVVIDFVIEPTGATFTA